MSPSGANSGDEPSSSELIYRYSSTSFFLEETDFDVLSTGRITSLNESRPLPVSRGATLNNPLQLAKIIFRTISTACLIGCRAKRSMRRNMRLRPVRNRFPEIPSSIAASAIQELRQNFQKAGDHRRTLNSLSQHLQSYRHISISDIGTFDH